MSAQVSYFEKPQKLTPRVKYPHTATIQKVRFSPINNASLISASASDFGYFAPNQKDVTKTSIGDRITDIAWSPMGDRFCFTTQSGRVSLRSVANGQEKVKFERESEIWAVEWLPVENSKKTQIIIYDWFPSGNGIYFFHKCIT